MVDEYNDELDELSIKARRGEATRTELQRLEWLLERSSLGRWLHEVGCDFDRQAGSGPEDARLLDATVARAKRAFEGVPPSGSRGVPVGRSIPRADLGSRVRCCCPSPVRGRER